MTFDSRKQAGKLLANELKTRRTGINYILGLTRGGVIIAAELARVLKIPFYPLIVKKISPSFESEFAVGAISEIPGSVKFAVWWNDQTDYRLEPNWQQEQIELEKTEVAKLRKKYIADFIPPRPPAGGIIIITDDGAATGATMLAAIKAVHVVSSKTLVALPVSTPEAASLIFQETDQLIILSEDPQIMAVGQAYARFNQVEWDEVRSLMSNS